MPNLTTKILIEIRDEMKETRRDLSARLDATRSELSARIDATNERLDSTNERLETVARRQVESEVRLATELVAVGTAVKELTQTLRYNQAIEGDMSDLKQRVSRLEERSA